jgi:hypothetical protein
VRNLRPEKRIVIYIGQIIYRAGVAAHFVHKYPTDLLHFMINHVQLSHSCASTAQSRRNHFFRQIVYICAFNTYKVP